MENKEILINDVDVSKCIYYRRIWGNNYNYCNIHNNSCYSSSSCYYKQYKRKEQECEKLKNWVKNMMFDTDRKDWFEHFVECFEDWKKGLFKQLDKLKAENQLYKQAHSTEQNRRREYEQTLQEIKEIAECCYDPVDKENDSLWTILQKIKEVLNV